MQWYCDVTTSVLSTQALGVITFLPSPEPPVDYSSQSMYLMSAIYAAVVLGLLGWAIFEHATRRLAQPTAFWRVATTKLLLFVGMHSLSVAILASLLAPLDCPDDEWMNEPMIACGSAAIVAMAAGGVALALPLLTAHVTVALVCINRVPDPENKHNRLCASHGRVQALLAALRFARICFGAVGGSSLSPTLQLALDFGLGLAWLVLYVRFLPYRKQVRMNAVGVRVTSGFIIDSPLEQLPSPPSASQWLNRMQCAMAAVYLSAAIACAYGISAPKTGGAVLLFVCTAPLAAFAAWQGAAVGGAPFPLIDRVCS